ncbi:conjugative transposon protein TraN [Algoriphagus halophilus]|uniref:Bacteroides conjugative transposon TraN protein n=1 Tax=Algoriphagus halophilus TaxID=226505 RepID=A0A1N6E6Y6_9BACT|nr:conjugative transposon protein TraN [Algoriphagus halophilus]SIN78789.1 Bacteroides conjugative transposon TraN protein [Algoriphagus halophilus]
MNIHTYLLITLLGSGLSLTTLAQVNTEFETKPIYGSTLQVSDLMTSHLIFPHPIKSVDRGNRNILVQKAQAVKNMLQVKAENSELPNSNLTVITEDGGFYSFMVSYAQNPENLNWSIHPGDSYTQPALQVFDPTPSEIQETAQLISLKHRSMHPIRQRRYLTGMALTGIYIENDLLYFQIQLENQTNIAYDTEQFRLFIRDNKQSKRSASQELEQIPILIWGDSTRIPAQSTQTLVVVLSKFTLPNQKHLGIELMEQKGGRNLKIKVKNRHLMQAMVLD